MRILSTNLPDYVDKTAEVAGWLHKKRALGALMFIVLRDRGGLVQIVVDDESEQEKLRGAQVGTVLRVTGKVVKEERAAGGVELHNPKVTVEVLVEDAPLIEIDKPIDHKSENLETLFEHRVIGVRNVDEQQIFRVRAEMNRYIREFLTQHEFIEIQTPKLLAKATEGGAEVFKLDYFGQEATLAQSPQFYKQIMVGAFERVFEIGPTFRAEPSTTTRHVSEVTMLDIEMGFIDSHEDVLNMVQDMTYDVLTRTYKEHADKLARLKAPELVIKPKFPRYSVAQVHDMYTSATGTDTTKEKDLIPDEERWLCEYAKEHDGCEAVFVTHFPVEAMKFYHMINPDDPSTVLWADLLFRGLEIATCPQREHHYEKLVAQMQKAGLNPSDEGYKYYLQAFQYGLPAHGGCGYGIDRLVEKTLGLNNVKEAILFPRDLNRLTP